MGKKHSKGKRKAFITEADYEQGPYYGAFGILTEDQSRQKYLIDWEPDDVTGEIFVPTWEPMECANALLREDWEREKERKQNRMRKVGRNLPKLAECHELNGNAVITSPKTESPTKLPAMQQQPAPDFIRSAANPEPQQKPLVDKGYMRVVGDIGHRRIFHERAPGIAAGKPTNSCISVRSKVSPVSSCGRQGIVRPSKKRSSIIGGSIGGQRFEIE